MTQIDIEEELTEEPGIRLNPELSLQIRKRVIEGKLYIDIQSELGIKASTWDSWVYRDTQGFRENLLKWKAERFLRIAEENMPTLLISENEKVKADMTKFVLETAGKSAYAKRGEVTGKDGGPVEANFSLTSLLRKANG